MPLMSRDEHENFLNELLNPELEQSRRTEILQRLRVDHVEGHQDYEQLTTSNAKLKGDNDDLIISNSKLFRQLSITTPEEKEKVEEKELSQTITLEQIEGRQ